MQLSVAEISRTRGDRSRMSDGGNAMPDRDTHSRAELSCRLSKACENVCRHVKTCSCKNAEKFATLAGLP